MTKCWIPPMWKPSRPYCLSRVEVTLAAGEDPLPFPPELNIITVHIVVAEDPETGPGKGYDIIGTASLEKGANDDEIPRRIVADIEQRLGPRIINPGWWVAAYHEVVWASGPDVEDPVLSLQLHGTPV